MIDLMEINKSCLSLPGDFNTLLQLTGSELLCKVVELANNTAENTNELEVTVQEFKALMDIWQGIIDNLPDKGGFTILEYGKDTWEKAQNAYKAHSVLFAKEKGYTPLYAMTVAPENTYMDFVRIAPSNDFNGVMGIQVLRLRKNNTWENTGFKKFSGVKVLTIGQSTWEDAQVAGKNENVIFAAPAGRTSLYLSFNSTRGHLMDFIFITPKNDNDLNEGLLAKVARLNDDSSWQVSDYFNITGGGDGSSYILPKATDDALGGVKASPAGIYDTDFIHIDENGYLRFNPGDKELYLAVYGKNTYTNIRDAFLEGKYVLIYVPDSGDVYVPNGIMGSATDPTGFEFSCVKKDDIEHIMFDEPHMMGSRTTQAAVTTSYAVCSDRADPPRDEVNTWYVPKTMPKPSGAIGAMVDVFWKNGRVDGLGYNASLIWGEPGGADNVVIVDGASVNDALTGEHSIPAEGTVRYQLEETSGRKHWKYVSGPLIPKEFSTASAADQSDKFVHGLVSRYIPGMDIYLQMDNGNTADLMRLIPDDGYILPVYGNGEGTHTGNIPAGYILHLKNAGDHWQIINAPGGKSNGYTVIDWATGTYAQVKAAIDAKSMPIIYDAEKENVAFLSSTYIESDPLAILYFTTTTNYSKKLRNFKYTMFENGIKEREIVVVDSTAILYTPQGLNTAQQEQARKNIGVTEGGVALKPLTFTGASTAEYDGTKPVTVNIPTGGGGGGGSNEWKLLADIKAEEPIDVRGFVEFAAIDKDVEGQPFELSEIFIATDQKPGTRDDTDGITVKLLPVGGNMVEHAITMDSVKSNSGENFQFAGWNNTGFNFTSELVPSFRGSTKFKSDPVNSFHQKNLVRKKFNKISIQGGYPEGCSLGVGTEILVYGR